MGNVLFVSGHLTDDADRARPRFPDTAPVVDDVQAQLSRALTDWRVGPGWTLVTGGARGADLLAAELALDLGAQVRLCLAFAREEFVARSVATTAPNPGRDWPALFARVAAQARLDVLPTAPSRDVETAIFARANDWMLDIAGPDADLHALLVWDGREGTAGGTGAVVARLDERIADPTRIRIVDPVPRAYADRQRSSGPKRILSLDGGGLRGVISLEILAEIESQLRHRLGDDDLVLADYFDYLAGTSTGAIIASALALGRPVAEIRDRYHSLGQAAFRRSLAALAQGARFGAEAVQRQLLDFFDDDLVLGDPALRTLLLLVLHRTDTDSPWLLSNCTNARYNRTDRLLPRNRHDRNLDLPLLSLIRASTAAPTYFPMQLITIGGQQVAFQDGGVTAFNNPALIAAVMATLPAYGLQWDKGVDDLLVVSVGTGSRAATGRSSRPGLVSSLSSLARLPSVFMNGSAFSQDLLCRVMGDCRYGPPLDSEVGALLGQQLLPNTGIDDGDPAAAAAGGIPVIGEYFSFVRYDADLGPQALARTDIPRRDWKGVRRMDDASQIDNWRLIGRHTAAQVDVARHFRGFLELPVVATI